MLNFLMMIYAMVVGFVLSTAGRNQREMRPNALPIVMAGHVALSASATLAVLLGGWAFLHLLGVAPELVLA